MRAAAVWMLIMLLAVSVIMLFLCLQGGMLTEVQKTTTVTAEQTSAVQKDTFCSACAGVVASCKLKKYQ